MPSASFRPRLGASASVLLGAAALVALALPARAEPPRRGGEGGANAAFELDIYYTSLRGYANLSKAPIPYMRGKREWEIYKDLMRRSLRPRDVAVETGFYPLAYMGTAVREDAPHFYNGAQWTKNLNLVQALTQGFEEPWSLSLFVGDVVQFRSIQGQFIGKSFAYSGYLASAGNFHILNNVLVPDDWLETEWKIKGDEIFPDRTLRWSFRTGTRFNDNHEIANTFYISLKRSRIDYKSGGSWLLDNSGYQYTVDFSQRDIGPVRHYFTVEKKFPFTGRRMALNVATGFVYTAVKKYSGTLAQQAATRSRLQIILRPNLQF